MDTQTSDRDAAFQVIQEAVMCLLDEDPPSANIAEGAEDIDQWYNRLSTPSGGSTVAARDSAALSSYGCLLKTIIAHVSFGIHRYIENKTLLKQCDSQSRKAIDGVKQLLSKKHKKSQLFTIEYNYNIGEKNGGDSGISGLGVHHSIVKMSECFDFLTEDICLRNALIEALCRDVCSLSGDMEQAKAAAYTSELDVSRCKREKNTLESILRSKMSSQDFFDLLRPAANSNLRHYSTSSIEEKDSDGNMSPQHIDFCSSSLSGFGDNNSQLSQDDDDDDCAGSSVSSWGSAASKEDSFSPAVAVSAATASSSMLRSAGRAARVSSSLLLRGGGGGGGKGRGGLLDESRIADMFSADTELDF